MSIFILAEEGRTSFKVCYLLPISLWAWLCESSSTIKRLKGKRALVKAVGDLLFGVFELLGEVVSFALEALRLRFVGSGLTKLGSTLAVGVSLLHSFNNSNYNSENFL
jgi:hypothetical protein